eukprot:EC123127.1.p1 GENE.EC123127.1~~EC123127.1.p1  ORF type:complete len:179 (+),score=29.67 EC123127.1:72-608(+)
MAARKVALIVIDGWGLSSETRGNDTMIFFNFRSDRMREPVETFAVQRNFETSTKHPEGLLVVAMTQYAASFPCPIIFPQQHLDNVLAEWFSKHKIPQFHTAETEKYAHVTFFFNGGREAAFEGEDRRLVSSPKVATYDLEPKMSAAGVAESLSEAIASGKYPFAMCNFAPPDMVGHTG